MPRGIPNRKPAPPEREFDDDPIVRRNISAHKVPAPPTSAPASVFDLAKSLPKPRRKQAPSIDPDAIAIERGVPVPPPKPKRSPYLTLLQRMRPRDMVRITAKQAWSMKSAAKAHGIAVTMRSLEVGVVGCWRV